MSFGSVLRCLVLAVPLPVVFSIPDSAHNDSLPTPEPAASVTVPPDLGYRTHIRAPPVVTQPAYLISRNGFRVENRGQYTLQSDRACLHMKPVLVDGS